MTIRDLISQLSGMDQDRIVILQKDAEGNGYSPLSGADDNALYDAANSYSGDVGYETLTDELKGMGYSEDDLGSGNKCVVLYPVN